MGSPWLTYRTNIISHLYCALSFRQKPESSMIFFVMQGLDAGSSPARREKFDCPVRVRMISKQYYYHKLKMRKIIIRPQEPLAKPLQITSSVIPVPVPDRSPGLAPVSNKFRYFWTKVFTGETNSCTFTRGSQVLFQLMFIRHGRYGPVPGINFAVYLIAFWKPGMGHAFGFCIKCEPIFSHDMKIAKE